MGAACPTEIGRLFVEDPLGCTVRPAQRHGAQRDRADLPHPVPRRSAPTRSIGTQPSPWAATDSQRRDDRHHSAGEFSVYNNVGTVNAIIDISGYYVHHKHDDELRTRINIGHTEFEGVTNTITGRFAGSGFVAPSPDQCMVAHLPLAEGASITGVALTAAGGLGVLTQGLVTPPVPVPVVLDTFNLYVVACSDDAFSVTGASVGVEYG